MRKFAISLLLALPMVASAYNDDIELSDIELKQTTNGVVELSGVAKNTSGKTLKNIILTYAAYREGMKVQESPAIMGTLQPNERWQFSALLVNAFDDYKLQSVTYQQTEK